MNSASTLLQSALPASLCYLNGDYGRVCDTKVSVMDRGFIFGDGVYEVIPAYNGHPFCFDQHMARLDRSLNAVRIDNPLSQAEWLTIAQRLIADFSHSSGESNQLIYIQVTRGIAPRDHVMVPGLQPTVYVMVSEMKSVGSDQRGQGVACISADDFRWKKAHIKSTSLLAAVLARQISAEVNAVETVMFREGYLSEAAASNVWMVKNGAVIGPTKDNLVLEGIRFGLIERICQAQGIPFELRAIRREEVLAADELLLSSTSKEVLPVTLLDGQPVGTGLPGPIYARLYAGYQALKDEQCA